MSSYKTAKATRERWKSIPDHPEYEISNRGRLRKYIQGSVCVSRKYPAVYLPSRDKTPIHLLVTQAFLGRKPKGMVVNHKDGNPLNNHIDNLEYVTHGENVAHAHRTGLIRHRYGSDHWRSKLTAVQRATVLHFRQCGWTFKRLAEAFGMSEAGIRHAVNRAEELRRLNGEL